jgi:hypothetical protein
VHLSDQSSIVAAAGGYLFGYSLFALKIFRNRHCRGRLKAMGIGLAIVSNCSLEEVK